MENETKTNLEEESQDLAMEEEDIDLTANLDQCHESCLEGVVHSLNEGGDFAKLDHIRWLLDCADICQLSTNFVLRHSDYAGDLLSTCAFVCEDCAQSCETFFEDEHMKNCAEICRNCAEACRGAIEEEEVEDIEEDITEEKEE